MLWVIMASIGAVLLIFQFFSVGFRQIFYLVFIPVMIGLVYLLFRLRLIFGGADAKAIMALTLLVPFEPRILAFPLWTSYMPFPWVVFCNALILFIFLPVSLLIFNVVKGNLEFPYCILGYKMSIEKAKQSFVWPLERIEKGRRRFSFIPRELKVDGEFKAFEKKGIDDIWVTPKLPFMVPLLAGFLASFFLGDILFYIMQFFISSSEYGVSAFLFLASII